MGSFLSNSVENCLQNVYYPYLNQPNSNEKDAAKINQMCNESNDLLAFSLFMIAFYSVLGSFMIYLTYKVKQLVWTEDKIIVTMLAFFTLHNWLSVIWYIVNIIGVKNF